MFLDMLTADAASKHGHEFSEPQHQLPYANNQWLPPRRRSPFKVLPYTTARQRMAPTRSRSVRGVVGELGELPEEADSSTAPAASRYRDMSVDDLHIPGSFRNDSPPISPPRARSATPRLLTSDVRAEPIKESVLEQAQSVAGSSISDKKSRRPKTQFSVAVPPPCALPLRKQGIARPRAFFQLQTRADSRFHRPIYELVPLSRIDGTRKVGQLIRRLGKVKENITSDDLAVVRVESYTMGTSSRREPVDISETRDVLGIISPAPRASGSQATQAQIFLDGAVWNATTGSSGRYTLQCVGTDRHTARWYVPKTQNKRAQSPGDAANASRKLYFAAILPHTTKHPTLASLSQTNLDVYDSYTLNTEASGADTASPSESTTPGSPQANAAAWLAQHTETSSTNVFNVPIDESHRRLIVVSSFWVMLCEGWSSQYSFPTAASSNSPAMPGALSTADRTLSLPVTKDDRLSAGITTRPASTLSTRQTTPERPSLCAVSPAPSVHTENSTSRANRLSLNSFTFRRSQGGSNAKQDDDVRSGKKDATSVPPNQGPSVDATISTDPTIEQQSKADPSFGSQDLVDSKFSSSRKIRPSSVFGLGSVVRRISTSKAPREGNERRSRSISWKRQPLSRSEATSSPMQSSEPYSAMQTAEVASAARPYGDQHDRPDSIAVDLCNGNEDEDDDLVSLEDPVKTSTAPRIIHDQSDSQKSPVLSQDTPRISASSDAEHKSDVAQESESDASNAVPFVRPKTAGSPAAPEYRHSSSSDDLHDFGVGASYWKDFDRLQTHTFWRRASSYGGAAAAREADAMFAPARMASVPTNTAADEVRPSIEARDEMDTPPRPVSMIGSIRQWSRRRKPSLVPGELPSDTAA